MSEQHPLIEYLCAEFDQVVHPDGPPYYKFESRGGMIGIDYGRMWEGKIVIWVNLKSGYSHPFVQIKQDGGTRTVFHGVIDQVDHLRLILKLIR